MLIPNLVQNLDMEFAKSKNPHLTKATAIATTLSTPNQSPVKTGHFTLNPTLLWFEPFSHSSFTFF
jgi:hypothetical protein